MAKSNKSYVRPTGRRIVRDDTSERLYQLEHTRTEAVKACASEWSRMHDVPESHFYQHAIPQALFDVLESFDPKAATLAAQAYLDRETKRRRLDIGPDTDVGPDTKSPTSLVVYGADGKRLCVVNLFDFGNGKGNVDVIIDGKTQRAEFLAWKDGSPQVRHKTEPGTTVHAINILPEA